MKKDLKVYIQDILDSLGKIEKYTKSISEKKFNDDIQLQDAVMRRLEIIGEAVKHYLKHSETNILLFHGNR